MERFTKRGSLNRKRDKEGEGNMINNERDRECLGAGGGGKLGVGECKREIERGRKMIRE